MRIRCLASLCCLLLVSCTSRAATEDAFLFTNDFHNVYRINMQSGEKSTLLKGSGLYKLDYNRTRSTLITTQIDHDQLGFYEVGKTTSRFPTQPVCSYHLYTYQQYVVLSSSQILEDAENQIMEQVGVYDLEKKRFVRTFKLYGDTRAITGHKDKAYVTTFDPDKNRSNVYEIDLHRLQLKSIFSTPQSRAPKVFVDSNDSAYALYTHWDFGIVNELHRIDLKTGKTQILAHLEDYTHHMTIIEGQAVVIHYDELNGQLDIPKPVSIVDLKTGKVTQVPIPNLRPSDIRCCSKDQVGITDRYGSLILLQPKTGKIRRIHVTNAPNGLLSLASPYGKKGDLD